MRTIRVTGSGRTRIRPDVTRVTMILDGLFKDYGETLRRSSEDTEKLKDMLAPFGFQRNDLKTLSFSVDPEYEGVREEDGTYTQRFTGYRFRHTMKVEFPSNNQRLGKVLFALANGPVTPEFHLSYTVGDPEAVKNALLGRAVADAREKAAALTRAGGVELGELQTIDYSWGQADLEVRPMNGRVMMKSMAEPAANSYDLNVEPDDIELTDSVTVVWEIV